MTREALTERLQSLQDRLRQDGISQLAIFGSRARGDHRDDSDLDLLVEVVPDQKFSLLDLIGVQHTVGDAIGMPVSALMRRSLSDDFRRRIDQDIVDIF